MTQLKQLHAEYIELKKRIFSENNFIEIDKAMMQSIDYKRYCLLFQFFNPQYRVIKDTRKLFQEIGIN